MKKLLIKLAAASLLSATVPTMIAPTATVHASSYSRTEMRNFVRNVFAQNNSRGSAVIIKDGSREA